MVIVEKLPNGSEMYYMYIAGEKVAIGIVDEKGQVF